MHMAERSTIIRAGSEASEEQVLPLMRLPGGATGALYRGQVFPLLPDGSIDITGPFSVPGVCSPIGEGQARILENAWWVLPGEPPLVLLRGDEETCQRLLAAIVECGGEIFASGPYLAGSEDEAPADWFALPRGLTAEEIRAVLETASGQEQGEGGAPAVQTLTPAEREVVLRDTLTCLRLEAQRAAGEVAAMGSRLAETEAARIEEGRKAQELAQQLAEAVARAAKADDPPDLPPQPQSVKRLAAAMGQVISTLLPRAVLLRDTETILARLLPDRGPSLLALRDLHDRPNETLANWKGVRGAGGWRERHLSTGQDDSGRLYARLRKDGKIEVLLSFKNLQDRDVDWLSRQ